MKVLYIPDDKLEYALTWGLLQDTLLETYRLATSKSTQRALLNTILLVSGAVTLLGLAAVATGLFFHNFVPRQVLTKLVYLQYG